MSIISLLPQIICVTSIKYKEIILLFPKNQLLLVWLVVAVNETMHVNVINSFSITLRS